LFPTVTSFNSFFSWLLIFIFCYSFWYMQNC
jgi:hypothetical protein